MKLTVLASAVVLAALVIADPAAAQPQRRGRNANAPPPGPAPRDADGRAILWGATPEEKGVWTPQFGITQPIHPADQTPFQPWARALFDARQISELEPHTRCKASGTARQFQTPYGVEIVNLPEIKRIFIFDIGGPHTFRTVYMDGREHPKDLEPSYYGHSVGHWEGDTLVIDSVGFNESFWMDRRGMPHTTQLHTIERFTRKDAETITFEITVDDPGAYTAPWTGGFDLGFERGVELFEYSCQQANYAVELMVGGGRSSIDRTSPIVP
ncbi:MAG TPA: hypothetical protein VN818_10815 [Gammaproteobacteria bacterium]|nr:hypothetical protein [Gammaproteobacteria bacterium]